MLDELKRQFGITLRLFYSLLLFCKDICSLKEQLEICLHSQDRISGINNEKVNFVLEFFIWLDKHTFMRGAHKQRLNSADWTALNHSTRIMSIKTNYSEKNQS